MEYTIGIDTGSGPATQAAVILGRTEDGTIFVLDPPKQARVIRRRGGVVVAGPWLPEAQAIVIRDAGNRILGAASHWLEHEGDPELPIPDKTDRRRQRQRDRARKAGGVL